MKWPSHLLLFTVVVVFPLLSFHSHILISVYSRFVLDVPSPQTHPLTPRSPLHNLPPASLGWWLPIEHRFTQSFGQCSNCVFSLCGLHREGVDLQLMRDVGRGRREREREAGWSKRRLLYTSSNPPPPPPPLLNGLVAIIPASRLHYSPHSIDLKSGLSISTHTHTHARIYMDGPIRCHFTVKTVMNPRNELQFEVRLKCIPFLSAKNSIKLILNVLLFSVIDIVDIRAIRGIL